MTDQALHAPAGLNGGIVDVPDMPGRLVAKIVLVWSGLCLCMGLLTAASAWAAAYGQRPAPLDAPVGLLWLYNRFQLGGMTLLAVLAVCSPRRTRWLARLSAPALAVVAQALWLTPPPTSGASGPLSDASPWASAYVAVEAFKAIWLLAVGFGPGPTLRRMSPAHARRSTWTRTPPVRPVPDRAWPPFPGP